MPEVNFTDLIANSQPRRRLSRMSVIVLVGLGVLVLSLISGRESERGDILSVVLMWLVLTGLLVSLFVNAARRQAMSKWSRKAADLCLMERWEEAAEPLRKVLKRPVNIPQIRYQGLLELAGVAENTGQTDQAKQIYRAISDEQPQGLLSRLARVGEAIVLLKLDQLADADAVIRQLEVGAEGPGLKSLVLLARLYQQIRTGHYAEALEDETGKCELARKGLSSKAGYVYGLLGLAKHNQADGQEAAGKYWQQATMLIRPETLVKKFPELSQLSQTYEAAEKLPEAESQKTP